MEIIRSGFNSGGGLHNFQGSFFLLFVTDVCIKFSHLAQFVKDSVSFIGLMYDSHDSLYCNYRLSGIDIWNIGLCELCLPMYVFKKLF